MYTIGVHKEEETSLTRRRKTHEEYISELKEKGIKVEVLEPYKGDKAKIKHLWKNCGHVTEAVPNKILRGQRCGKCLRQSNTKKTHAQYLEELKKKDIQAEPLEHYVTNATKIKHRWDTCGHVTNIAPNKILSGNGCRKCQEINFANISSKIREKRCLKAGKELDQKVFEIHGSNIMRDPKTPYVNSYTNLSWICNRGHQWESSPNSIKSGSGCPECANIFSKGETLTKEVLNEYGVEFKTQKEFSDLKRVRNLSYDFYIPSMNILIECQGQQHYEPSTFFHGENAEECFADQQERDQLKREYALQNGYLLLEISYKDYRKDRITEILQEAGILPDLIVA